MFIALLFIHFTCQISQIVIFEQVISLTNQGKFPKSEQFPAFLLRSNGGRPDRRSGHLVYRKRNLQGFEKFK